MVRDIEQSAAMGKLKDIIQERYGMGLQMRFMQEVSSLEMGSDGFMQSRGDLHIPIRVEDKLLATAVLLRGGELQVVEQETASQLIRLFLEPELFNFYVRQTSHNMMSEKSDDVVSIYEPMDLEMDDEMENFDIATNVICLQAENPNLIPRLSHNIHEVSHRWACLQFADIQNQVNCFGDIKSLGSLTLIIDDVLKIKPEHQEILYSYLENSTPNEDPLLVIGCTSPIEDLEKREMIHAGLASILKGHRLEVDRLPRDPELLQESLEIMLEI
jgi:hypothetical protein